MKYLSQKHEKLVEALRKLPGVGRKTALRLAFFLLKEPRENWNLPSDSYIRRNGARALRSSLAGRKIAVPLRALGLKADLSNDAGGYLCNMLFYLSLSEIGKRNSSASSLFVHIPPVSTIFDRRDLAMGAESIIRACATHARPGKRAVFPA